MTEKLQTKYHTAYVLPNMIVYYAQKKNIMVYIQRDTAQPNTAENLVSVYTAKMVQVSICTL